MPSIPSHTFKISTETVASSQVKQRSDQSSVGGVVEDVEDDAEAPGYKVTPTAWPSMSASVFARPHGISARGTGGSFNVMQQMDEQSDSQTCRRPPAYGDSTRLAVPSVVAFDAEVFDTVGFPRESFTSIGTDHRRCSDSCLSSTSTNDAETHGQDGILLQFEWICSA